MSTLHHYRLPLTVGGRDAGGAPSEAETEIREALQTSRARDASPAGAREARLRGMVDEHADFVARVLRNAGIPHADVDDEVQRTFIVAAKRLDDVRAGAEKSFLLRTALNMAAHARRTLARRREVREHEVPEAVDSRATPEQLTDQKRTRQMLDNLLDQMETNLRTVFVLYEFEEMNMAEIALALEIPSGTVASRLRRARADFRERVSLLQAGSAESTESAASADSDGQGRLKIEVVP